MALVAPFKGVRYNTQQVGDLSKIVTPPYDVIPKDDIPKYHAKSPYNFTRLILPPEETTDSYQAVNEILTKWKKNHIFSEDPYPSFYLYRQKFSVEGKTSVRNTLMCLVYLEEFSEKVIRPHEQTYGRYKEDRLKLLTATKHNFSHIFGMVKDPEGFLNSTFEKWEFETPVATARTNDDVEHTLWRAEGSKYPEVTQFFADKPIYIVDGHHRYESSVQYAKLNQAYHQKEKPGGWMLFAIANCFDPGLVVLPTHRLIRTSPKTPELSALHDQYDMEKTDIKTVETFVTSTQKGPVFVLYYKNGLYTCRPKRHFVEKYPTGKALNSVSVSWSDARMLTEHFGITDENRRDCLFYDRDVEALWNMRNDSVAIVFHAPTAISDVTNVADQGEYMPQKSTYFYPKLGAGLVFRELK